MKHPNALFTLLFSLALSGSAFAQDEPAFHVDVLYGVSPDSATFVVRQDAHIAAPENVRVVREPRVSHGCCSGARRPGLSVGAIRGVAPRTFTVLNQDGTAQVVTASEAISYSTGRGWGLVGEQQTWRSGLIVEAKLGAFVALEGALDEASFEPFRHDARPSLFARRDELIPHASIRTLANHETPGLWILGSPHERQVVLRGSQILFWMEGPPQYPNPAIPPALPRSLRRASATIAGAVRVNGSLFLLMTPRAQLEAERGFVLVPARPRTS